LTVWKGDFEAQEPLEDPGVNACYPDI
jgi:hypothetical protein